MRDLASLTAADFEAVVGTVFELVDAEPEPLRLRLAEVVELGERPDHRRPFSLLFGGPRSPILEHRTHRILHSGMGELELFLGPILSDSDGTTYEAVFA